MVESEVVREVKGVRLNIDESEDDLVVVYNRMCLRARKTGD